ncbi:MAG: PhoH family protein [Acidaminococcales bacterium]|nr:PhoH family protein [Acidaminococcales bacterium]
MSDADNALKVLLRDQAEALGIFGHNDEFLRLIGQAFSCRILTRGEEILLAGDAGETASLKRLFEELLFLCRQGHPLTAHDVRYGIRMVKEGCADNLHKMFSDTVIVTNRGRHIKAKTLGQWIYLEAIKRNFITIGIGPAGTGKTYLAVAMALGALKNKDAERIILTRPAVEAGEKLGFLPGDMQEKVDPYLRPLYDALYEISGSELFQKYMGKGLIEVAPLAYMRGRTLNDSFIILDEAQNATPEQMKMFLTRLGFGSKMVVAGDATQTDLPQGKQSGLAHAEKVLQGIDGIQIVRFSKKDVVRHEIVGMMIKAYENFDQRCKNK